MLAWSSRVGLLVVSLVLVVCLVEVGSRLYLHYLAGSDVFLRYASIEQLKDHHTQSLYAPHRHLGYIPTAGYSRGKNRHNSLGFRGEELAIPKPEGIYRVVCLGGSTTYSNEVEDYRHSFPFSLQVYLWAKGFKHVEVVNAGCPGYGSLESLLNLQLRVLEAEPDLVIVYHGVNEVHPRLVWPPTAYRRDNSGFTGSASFLQMPSIFEYSTAARILMLRMGIIRPQGELVRTLGRPPATSYALMFWEQCVAGSYPTGIFEKIPVTTMLEANRPIYFEQNLRAIVNLCRLNGAEVMLSTWAHFAPDAEGSTFGISRISASYP